MGKETNLKTPIPQVRTTVRLCSTMTTRIQMNHWRSRKRCPPLAASLA